MLEIVCPNAAKAAQGLPRHGAFVEFLKSHYDVLHCTCRVMDVIMADKMDQALLKAAVALLKRCEQQLLQMNDMEDALHLLKLELPGEGAG